MERGNLDWLAETLAQHIAEALELMTGDAPQVAWTTSEMPAIPGSLAWWAQTFNLAPGPLVWIGASEPSWREIGKHVLSAAGIEPGSEAEIKNTYQEILGQGLASLARSLSARLSREVACGEGIEQPPPEGLSCQALIDLTLSAGARASLWVAFSPALLAPSERAEQPEHPGEPRDLPETGEQVPELPEARARPGISTGARTLDLLLEVEMPVSVSFGRTQLPLRDVLKLTTGSIIELNRTVNEPVEVIVNNCVIARGEVVVVEGNYGIRIQEIISRQERLRTLR